LKLFMTMGVLTSPLEDAEENTQIRGTAAVTFGITA